MSYQKTLKSINRTNREGLDSVKKKTCTICGKTTNRQEIIKCFDPRVKVQNQHTPVVWCCDDCFDDTI